MSKLDFLNRYLFQWFFIRVCRSVNTVKQVKKKTVHSASAMDMGGHSIAYVIDDYNLKVTRCWLIMYWVVPTSGYGNGFRHIGRKRFIRISKNRTTIEPHPPPDDYNCRCTI